MKKAIFLDKDGTLIVDVAYNVNPEKVTLSKDCVRGLKRLQQHGYLLVIVSNQSGIAHGYFDKDKLSAVEHKIKMMLYAHDIILNGFYYCPHHPDGKVKPYAISCNCRKPQPGLLLKAAKDLAIDLQASWMIGDILNDVEAGNRAGCRSILIDNGNETEWIYNEMRQPAATIKNINMAADYIISTIKKDEQLVRL
ncbi:D-glycero-alpha-D-manno-heptose-1,7-bisphosphate 7-phosphatase [Mucilaginibacter pocheonensis]|uniref:D,D-heptose 1,7-bisphosphate phosphatase n=1 Tax=Mucilaginibacter pocheonensis TaxID=398050 RepID=A0ABU1TD55_9SPHI|nr:HAD family hydrolase [Mucilaginibacter pocheonensis]MDR6943181.1 D,D-heptose 1,7-bisphosphate phosphatase [Mucilaginibacter pocheonensis]